MELDSSSTTASQVLPSILLLLVLLLLLLLLLLLRRRSFWAGPFMVVDLMDAMRFLDNVGELELGAIRGLQGGTKSMSCRGKGRGEWGLGRRGVGGPWSQPLPIDARPLF
jgi:MYXO-CTERM domain-containing protein